MPEKKKYEYIRKTEVYEGKQYVGWGKTETEAYKKLAAKIEAAKRGEVVASTMTVKTWCGFWLETYQKPRVRAPGSPKAKGTLTPKSYRMYEEKTALITMRSLATWVLDIPFSLFKMF